MNPPTFVFTEAGLIQSSRRILAVDPGKSGAVCLMGGGLLEVRRDFKVKEDIARGIEDLAPMAEVLVMEFVHAFPGQGVCSVWSFGRAAGVADGALALCQPKLTVLEVAPQKWQNFVKAQLGLGKKDEFDSLAICRGLFPSFGFLFKRKLDHNTADACLIAAWAVCHPLEHPVPPQ